MEADPLTKARLLLTPTDTEGDRNKPLWVKAQTDLSILHNEDNDST